MLSVFGCTILAVKNMKFFDSLKIALHNLLNNKSRTILTIVIVFVVSSLIMAMCLLGTNFISIQDKFNLAIFDQEGTDYYLYQKYTDDNNAMDTISDANTVINIAKDYPDIVDECYFTTDEKFYFDTSNSSSPENPEYYQGDLDVGFAQFSIPFSSKIGNITKGRIWTETDNGTNGIWINEKEIERSYNSGIDFSIGKKIVVNLQNYSGNENKIIPIEYTINGIFAPNEGDRYNYYMPDCITSAAYTSSKLSATNNNRMRYFKMSYLPVSGSYSYKDTENRMTELVDKVTEKIGVNRYPDGRTSPRFGSYFIDQMQISKIMGVIIMAVLVLLAFLILILSIGSVANTIMISVDKNRKFIGLMKAMGLNNGGVKRIVYIESIMTILIGVLIGTFILFIISPLMLQLLNVIFGSMFGSYGVSVPVIFTIPFYVPLITILAFIGMAILFSRGSLNRICKADVITVISEVA